MKDDFRFEKKVTVGPSEAPVQLHLANAGQPPEGGLKYDNGKPDLSLVSHELMVAVARVREFGSKKYQRENWRKGFSFNRSIAAALRHIMAFKDGEDYDPESKHTHIAHAIACLEHLLNDFLYHEHNDDRFKRSKE